jgi:hypothetical protein
MGSGWLSAVFYRRGPDEYPCRLSVSEMGIEANGPRNPGGIGPLWFRTIDWAHIQQIEVAAGESETTLRLDGHRFRFPDISEPMLTALIGPHLAIVGSAFTHPDDPLASPELADMTFDSRRGGGDIWYSDWVTEDHRDLVHQSAEWLLSQTGVKRVRLEDHRALYVEGRFDESLHRALGAWWIDRVRGSDPGTADVTQT